MIRLHGSTIGLTKSSTRKNYYWEKKEETSHRSFERSITIYHLRITFTSNRCNRRRRCFYSHSASAKAGHCFPVLSQSHHPPTVRPPWSNLSGVGCGRGWRNAPLQRLANRSIIKAIGVTLPGDRYEIIRIKEGVGAMERIGKRV